MKQFFTLAFSLFFVLGLQAQTVQVTFRVDLSDETVSSSGVHVAGDFQNWSPNTTALTDDDGDGIYEVTVGVNGGATVNYKFVNGNDWGQNECGDGTSGCGDCGVDDGFNGHNRQYVIPSGIFGYLLPAYKYNSCELTAEATNTQEAISTIKGIEISPNPFSSTTRVIIENPTFVGHELIITDIAGKVVQNYYDVRNVVEIDRQNLDAGMYLVILKNDAGESLTRKLMVQ